MRRRLALLVVVVVMSAAACGDDADDAAPTTSTAADPAETSTTAAPPTTSMATTTTAAAVTTTSPPPASVGDGYTPQPDDVPWPTGEWQRGELDPAIDTAAIQVLVDEALRAEDGAYGAVEAVLIIENGELVFEDYGRGWSADQVHLSFSVAKSVTHAAVGILDDRGEIDAFGPVGAPEWGDDDERAAITYDDLLTMTSGLEWNEVASSFTDGDGLTAGSAQASKPLVAEPGETWVYSTGATAVVGRAIGDVVGTGDDFDAWMDENLFAPIGITSAELQFDASGYWVAGTGANMTARDFARLGLLYLRDGVWDGVRVLPAGWVDDGRESGPNPDYGSGLWTNSWYSPGSYSMEGFRGQNVVMVPDADVIVVTLADEPVGARVDALSQDLIDLLRAGLN